jgi:hypothetical protein
MEVEYTMKKTGGCLCGAIRFEVRGSPLSSDYCHCRMCQQSSGSVLTTWADFDKQAFRCTQGEITYYRSSEFAERGFCGNCGSNLVFRLLEGDRVTVATGSFDRPEAFPMGAHCGIESQVPWLKIDDALPRKTTKESMGFEVES